jgi:UDPglucose 6-dehydrogenase/GDP-mannose 6-dehydrogenase
MKVVIVGTGYVGLVTGACLADAGHDVICVDKDADRISAINDRRAPFYEPGLDELIARTVGHGRLQGSLDLEQSMTDADISILAVGTPPRNDEIDLGFVAAAGREIGSLLPKLGRYHVVVLKSTCTPGTADTLLRTVLEDASGMKAGQFGLCMNPEFLREGSAVQDFQDSDRIVIGAWDDRSADSAMRLYENFPCPKVRTSLRNAEMIKYTSNALLATLISFSNEIAALCEATPDLDERAVMAGLHLDRRLSPVVDGNMVRPGILSYLRAGIGFGGSCFPKDTLALRAFARKSKINTPLLDAVIDTNQARADKVLDLLLPALSSFDGAEVAVLGLAFKPDTDDVRESPGLRLADALMARGVSVRAWDPCAGETARKAVRGAFPIYDKIETAIKGADAAVIATAWPECNAFDWRTGMALMRKPVLLDGRDIVHVSELPENANYISIGRQPNPMI